MGDKDMWSFEGPPTLQETYNRLQEELHILFEIKEVCEQNNLQLLAYHMSWDNSDIQLSHLQKLIHWLNTLVTSLFGIPNFHLIVQVK